MWHLVVLVLTWRSAVLALQLGLDDVKAIAFCPAGVDTCKGRTTSLNTSDYADRRCFCDEECHLFGECCVDRAVRKDTPRPADGDGPTGRPLSQDTLTSDVRGEINETTEVSGIPRDRWGCQNLVITTDRVLPVKTVRMVVRCPAHTSAEIFQKCAALDRNSSSFHYTMDVPVLSLASRIWYQNVYCAICNGDAGNLTRLTYSLQCQHNYTREEVLREGKYSTQPLEWIMFRPERSICRLKTELQPGVSPGFLRPCGKNHTSQKLLLIENCPSDWTDHETAKKCSAYAFYTKLSLNVTDMTTQSSANGNSTVLSQVFKNPHCALCNGVPPLNTTCWIQLRPYGAGRRVFSPSLAIVIDFVAWKDENQQHRSCRPPGGVWDVLHETCMGVANEDKSDRSGLFCRCTDNKTCYFCTAQKRPNRIDIDNVSLRKLRDFKLVRATTVASRRC